MKVYVVLFGDTPIAVYSGKNKKYVDRLLEEFSAISTAELMLNRHIPNTGMRWFGEHDHEAMKFDREILRMALENNKLKS